MKRIYQTLLLGMKGIATRAINTRFIQPAFKSMMKLSLADDYYYGGSARPAPVDSRKFGPGTLYTLRAGYISDGKVNQQGYYCIDAVSSVQECLCLKKYTFIIVIIIIIFEGKKREGERSYIGSCHCDLLGS